MGLITDIYYEPELKVKLKQASQFYFVNSDKYCRSRRLCHLLRAHNTRGYWVCLVLTYMHLFQEHLMRDLDNQRSY